MHLSITVNGEVVSRETEPRQLLVHFIRETLLPFIAIETSMIRPPDGARVPLRGAGRVW